MIRSILSLHDLINNKIHMKEMEDESIKKEKEKDEERREKAMEMAKKKAEEKKAEEEAAEKKWKFFLRINKGFDSNFMLFIWCFYKI